MALVNQGSDTEEILAHVLKPEDLDALTDAYGQPVLRPFHKKFLMLKLNDTLDFEISKNTNYILL